MSIPLIVNRAPANGATAGIDDSARFSLRDRDSDINRSTLQCYLGAGPAFWSGGVLPLDQSVVHFDLAAFSGAIPDDPVLSTLEIGGELKIVKGGPLPRAQEGMYLFGGLQSPAEAEEPLMAEFEVKLFAADAVTENDFTGVAFGLFSGVKGIAVKFLYDGVDVRLEVHRAARAVTTPPSILYSVPQTTFNWDGIWAKYKILWHPLQDKMQLLLSGGDDDTPDVLLVDGLISDFADLPVEEQRSPVPLAFFGHLENGASSTSYWNFAALYNTVTTAVVNGIFAGGHVGFIVTDESTVYLPSVVPDKDDIPWNPLPASFGDLGGQVEVNSSGLVLSRTDPAKSLGFYRAEPKVASGVTVADFRLDATCLFKADDTVSTGMGFYVDDGVRRAHFVFLRDAQETQYVALLQDDGAPKVAASYLAVVQSFDARVDYRVIFDPSGAVILKYLIPSSEGGTTELFALGLTYTDLPLSSMPGPGIGVLHDASFGEATGILRVARMCYSVLTSLFAAENLPWLPWSDWALYSIGTGTAVLNDAGAVVLTDGSATAGDRIALWFQDVALQSDNGFMVETRMRVTNFVVGGAENDIRNITGGGIFVDDGTHQLALMFADAGPPNGKIVFFAPDGKTFEQVLFDIRAGESYTDELFALVDWSEFHLYRLQRTVGGKVTLTLDDSLSPLLSYVEADSPYRTTEVAGVLLGSSSAAVQTTSEVEYAKVVVSRGLDVSVKQRLSEEELFARFDHSINVIVEAEAI